MIELISDQKKFKELKEDPTLKPETVLQQTFREINKKNIFSDIEYLNLHPNGTNQLNCMDHLKYTKLSYEVLFLLFDLLSPQSALITAIFLST